MINKLRNSILVAKAVRKLGDVKIEEADAILESTNFKGYYSALVCSMRAHLAFIMAKRKLVVELVKKSNAICEKFDNQDTKYIKIYNKFLISVISCNDDDYARTWHMLAITPCSKVVKDYLIVGEFCPPPKMKDTQGKRNFE